MRVTRLRTQLEWNDNGLPRVVGKEIISKAAVNDLNNAAFTLPYVLEVDENGEVLEGEKEFEGMINAEVAAIRRARSAAKGDYDSHVFMLDRICGKPKQSVESTSMSMTYQEYLNTLPPPPSDEEVEAQVTALLELRPEDGSHAQSIKLRRLQYQEMTDDL
jgi:hypothetical protein